MKKTSLALLLVIFLQTAISQGIQQILPTVDSLYKAFSIKNNLPGMTYGIVYNGKLIKSGGIGSINIAKTFPQTAVPSSISPP